MGDSKYPNYLEKYNINIIKLLKYAKSDELVYLDDDHFIYYNLRLFINKFKSDENYLPQPKLLSDIHKFFSKYKLNTFPSLPSNLDAWNRQIKIDKKIYKKTYKQFIKKFGRYVVALDI